MESVGNKAHCKVSSPSAFHDFRPVVPTSSVMKCLEDILRNYLCESTVGMRDPLQFAYCKSRSVQDGNFTLMDEISEDLDNRKLRLEYCS